MTAKQVSVPRSTPRNRYAVAKWMQAQPADCEAVATGMRPLPAWFQKEPGTNRDGTGLFVLS